MDDIQISKTETILKRKEKASFFVVNFGNIPIMTLIGGFLLIFYTDVVGLEPGAVAIIFLITRIIDAFNDPILGYIIDHLPKTKWGRFRPYIVLGSMICSINYIILWLGPALAPSGKLLIAFISYIFLGITFDLMDIPLNSMIPVMSETGKDRDSLSLIKSLGYTFGSILFYGLTIPLVSSFPTPLIGYIVLIVSSSAFVFLVSTIGTLGVRERIEPISKEKYKLKELFKILSAKPVFIHFSSSLTNSISSGASVAAAIYFVTYVVKIPELVTVFVILLVIGRLIGFPLGKPILNKYGKKDTIVIGSFITNIPLFFILLVDPSNLIMIFIIYTISGIGGGFNMIVGYGLQADNTDYVEWKQGKRAEAAIASLVSFTNKAGLGIGAALVGIILALTNYVPNVDQSPLAIQGIYWAFIIVPAMLGLISGLIILFFYPLTKEMNTKIFLSLNELRHQNSEK